MTPPSPDQTNWDDVDTLQQLYESLWDQGRRPNLSDFLGQYARHPQRSALTFRLVRADLWRRLKAGDVAPLVQEYLTRYRDDLGRDRQAELVRLEYRWRWQLGDVRTRREEYLGRAEFAGLVADETELALPEWHCRNPRCERPRGHRLADENDAEAVCPACGSRVPVADLYRPTQPSGLDGRPYELPRTPLASGGMGEIYLVRDPGLGRELALKVVHPHWKGSRQAERRLEREARIVGGLQHPAIVPVHNLGRLPDGRLYFTMKLIRGRTIRVGSAEIAVRTLADELTHRDGPSAGLPRLLAIFEQACQAVAFAHERRVIHRDLKPANIMVGEFGEVQVMDWGLAKELAPGSDDAEEALQERRQLLEAVAGGIPSLHGTLLTQPGQVLGTLLYLPPEQARGDTAAHGPASDVFALGAILCEVLTGFPPYVDTDEERCLKPDGERPAGGPGFAQRVYERARAGDTRPGQRRLAECRADPDLVQIARDCLAPEAGARPADAGRVADRVARYQADVRQRAEDQRVEREKREEAERREAAARQASRYFLLATALALVFLVAAVGAALYYVHLAGVIQTLADDNGRKAVSEASAKELAYQRLREAQRQKAELAYRQGLSAADVWRNADGAAWMLRAGEFALSDDPIQGAIRANVAELLERTPRLHAAAVFESTPMALAFDPTGKRLYVAGSAKRIDLFDAETGKSLGDVPLPCGVNALALHPDGKTLYLAGVNGKVLRFDVSGAAPKELPPWPAHNGPVLAVAVHPDGKELVTGGEDGRLVLSDIAKEEILLEAKPHGRLGGAAPSRSVRAVAFDAKGTRLASGGGDGGFVVTDWTDPKKKVVRRDEVPGFNPVWRLAWVPYEDDEYLAVGTSNGSVTLWNDQPRPQEPFEVVKFGKTVTALAPQPGRNKGELFAAGLGAVGNLTFAPQASPYATLRLPNAIQCAAWNPTGTRLAVGIRDEVRIWDTATRMPRHDLKLPGLEDGDLYVIGGIHLHPDGGRRATTEQSKKGRIWVHDFTRDGVTKTTTFPPQRPSRACRLSPDAQDLLVAYNDGEVERWRVDPPKMLWKATLPGEPLSFDGSLAFSADGRHWAAARRDGTVVVGDGPNGKKLAEVRLKEQVPLVVCFDPTGDRLLVAANKKEVNTASDNGALHLWAWRDPNESLRTQALPFIPAALQLSPDGKSVLVGGSGDTILTFDVATTQPLELKVGVAGDVRALAFDPAGEILAVLGESGGVEFRHWPTGLAVGLGWPHGSLGRVAFTADGRLVADSLDVVDKVPVVSIVQRSYPAPLADYAAARRLVQSRVGLRWNGDQIESMPAAEWRSSRAGGAP